MSEDAYIGAYHYNMLTSTENRYEPSWLEKAKKIKAAYPYDETSTTTINNWNQFIPKFQQLEKKASVQWAYYHDIAHPYNMFSNHNHYFASTLKFLMDKWCNNGEKQPNGMELKSSNSPYLYPKDYCRMVHRNWSDVELIYHQMLILLKEHENGAMSPEQKAQNRLNRTNNQQRHRGLENTYNKI